MGLPVSEYVAKVLDNLAHVLAETVSALCAHLEPQHASSAQDHAVNDVRDARKTC